MWVVDSGDRMRMEDCKQELHSLLTEDVRALFILHYPALSTLAHGYHFGGLTAARWGVAPGLREQTGSARLDD